MLPLSAALADALISLIPKYVLNAGSVMTPPMIPLPPLSAHRLTHSGPRSRRTCHSHRTHYPSPQKPRGSTHCGSA